MLGRHCRSQQYSDSSSQKQHIFKFYSYGSFLWFVSVFFLDICIAKQKKQQYTLNIQYSTKNSVQHLNLIYGVFFMGPFSLFYLEISIMLQYKQQKIKKSKHNLVNRKSRYSIQFPLARFLMQQLLDKSLIRKKKRKYIMPVPCGRMIVSCNLLAVAKYRPFASFKIQKKKP